MDNSQVPRIFVDLDTQSMEYTAGDMVSGRIWITEKEANINQLSLSLEGKAQVDWWHSPSHIELAPEVTRETYKRTYRHIRSRLQIKRNYRHNAEEKSQSFKIILVDGGYGKKSPDGSFPFSFKLSRSLPSTFSHKFGSISYNIKAELERGLSKARTFAAAEIPIVIHGILDIKRVPSTYQAQTKEINNGRLSVKIELQKSGFVPGERFKFSCDIVNDFHIWSKAGFVTAVLMKAARFKTKDNDTTVKSNVFEIESPTVHPGSCITWAPDNIRIPDLPPSSKQDATFTLIDIHYYLEIQAKVADFLNCVVTEKLPIIIGTKSG